LILAGESWAKPGIERVTAKSSVRRTRNMRIIRSSTVIAKEVDPLMTTECSAAKIGKKLITGVTGFKS